MDVGRHGLAPVGTGASSEEGATCTKEVFAVQGGGKAGVGRSAANHFDSFRLGRFGGGRKTRAVSGWSGRYSWVNSWTLRGGLGGAHIGGIGNVLVPRRTEGGEDFAADGTGAIERGVLTTTVDKERGLSLYLKQMHMI